MVNTELIIDLGKLYKKYGPDSFNELADFLKRPSNIESLSLILENAPKYSRKEQTSKKVKKDITPSSLESLKDSDSDKFNFLDEFYKKILSKEILNTLKEINFFREDNGLSLSRAKTHKDAIAPLINDLSRLSMEQLKKIEVKSIIGNNDLQSWSNIILNRK